MVDTSSSQPMPVPPTNRLLRLLELLLSPPTPTITPSSCRGHRWARRPPAPRRRSRQVVGVRGRRSSFVDSLRGAALRCGCGASSRRRPGDGGSGRGGKGREVRRRRGGGGCWAVEGEEDVHRKRRTEARRGFCPRKSRNKEGLSEKAEFEER